jgi:hypothetical protein
MKQAPENIPETASGETNLRILLRTMRPELQQGEFVFCTVPESDFKQAELASLCVFREQEGITLILRREEAEKLQLEYAYVARLITLQVHSSLDAVGFLAAITAALAQHRISVNAVSAYYHDHLFVPADRADDAARILQDLTT